MTRRKPCAASEVSMNATARRIVSGRLVVGLVAAVLAGACSAQPSRAPQGTATDPPASTPAASAPPAASASPTASGTVPARSPSAAPLRTVRSCADAVYGELGHAWRRDAVVVGAVAFVGLRNAATEAPLKLPGSRMAVIKTLAVVPPGRQVTVTIDRPATRYAALLYDGERFREDGRYDLSDGTAAVTFLGCSDREAQFNGSFLVDGRRCVPVTVREPNGARLSRSLSFGAGRCSSLGG
jgi:hypothetical protein